MEFENQEKKGRRSMRKPEPFVVVSEPPPKMRRRREQKMEEETEKSDVVADSMDQGLSPGLPLEEDRALNAKLGLTVVRDRYGELRQRMVKSCAQWNSALNKDRHEERQCSRDLQTGTLHYPESKMFRLPPEATKVGQYPVALFPGQFTDNYKTYTPEELNHLPLKTVRFGPVPESKNRIADSDFSNGMAAQGFSLGLPLGGDVKSTRRTRERGRRTGFPRMPREARTTQTRSLTMPLVVDKSRCSNASSTSTSTTGKAKRFTKDPIEERKPVTAETLFEYQWPLNDKNADFYFLQERISEYLGVKSFKRKYPDIRRRLVDMEELYYLRNLKVVSRTQYGLTAVYSREVLDIMFNDFREKYEEYAKVVRERACEMPTFGPGASSHST